jgi:hypothetical protein
MDSLANDSRYIGKTNSCAVQVQFSVNIPLAQVRGQVPLAGSNHRQSDEPVEDVLKSILLSMLGPDFPLQWQRLCSHDQNSENDKGPVVFSALSKVCHNYFLSYHQLIIR